MTTATQTQDPELTALVAQTPNANVLLDRMRQQTVAEIAQGRSIADLLTRQGPAWLQDAKPQQIAAFARVCTALGLNPLVGEAYLIHGALYIGVQGRRKRAVQTGEFDGEGTPRLLTPEEREVYGVREGDVARIVQVWRKGMRFPAEGCGIVRKGEIENARKKRDGSPAVGPDGLPYHPLARDPEGMAIKRAATGAYKRGFADIDLPTADVDRSTMRIIDVESGETVANAVAEATDTPRLARVEQPRVVDEATGEIAGDVHEPVPPAVAADPYMRLAEAAMRANPGADAPTIEEIRVMLGGADPDELGVTPLTIDDAEVVVVACWAWAGARDAEGQVPPLHKRASLVHLERANSGLPFIGTAIEDEDAYAAAMAAEAPPQPAPQETTEEAPPPAPQSRRARGGAGEQASLG